MSIEFTLGAVSTVNASIFDIHGRMVMPLTRAVRNPGSYTLTWNGMAEHGRKAPAGTYILRIVAAGEVISHKIVMVK